MKGGGKLFTCRGFREGRRNSDSACLDNPHRFPLPPKESEEEDHSKHDDVGCHKGPTAIYSHWKIDYCSIARQDNNRDDRINKIFLYSLYPEHPWPRPLAQTWHGKMRWWKLRHSWSNENSCISTSCRTLPPRRRLYEPEARAGLSPDSVSSEAILSKKRKFLYIKFAFKHSALLLHQKK